MSDDTKETEKNSLINLDQSFYESRKNWTRAIEYNKFTRLPPVEVCECAEDLVRISDWRVYVYI